MEKTFDFSPHILGLTKDFTGREWVFEKIDGWLNKPNASRFFLVMGEPGSGKSALAARLTQISDGLISTLPGSQSITHGVLSAIHFCSARERQWINPHTFIESLALQLSSRYPAYAVALAEKSSDEKLRIVVRQQAGSISGEGKQIGVYIENLDVSRVSAEDAFVRVISQPLQVLYRAQPDTQVVILVDGLDETLLYTGEIGILPLLAQTEAMPNNVRLLITSRQDSRIEAEFMAAEVLFLSADQFEQKNDNDIQKYVERKVEEEPTVAEKQAQLPLEQRQFMFATFVRKAAGNFRYVTFLVAEIIAGKRDLTDLDGLPEGLDQLYYQSLERLVELGQKSWDETYAPVMGIVMVAQSRLYKAQLMQLTGMDETKISLVLGDLEQFIQWFKPEAGRGVVSYQLYHQSVADFLAKEFLTFEKKPILKNRFYLPASTWHQQMVDRYWDRCHADWARCDEYGLLYLTTHQALVIEANPGEKSHVRRIVNLATNSKFVEARSRLLGSTAVELEISALRRFHLGFWEILHIGWREVSFMLRSTDAFNAERLPDKLFPGIETVLYTKSLVIKAPPNKVYRHALELSERKIHGGLLVPDSTIPDILEKDRYVERSYTAYFVPPDSQKPRADRPMFLDYYVSGMGIEFSKLPPDYKIGTLKLRVALTLMPEGTTEVVEQVVLIPTDFVRNEYNENPQLQTSLSRRLQFGYFLEDVRTFSENSAAETLKRYLTPYDAPIEASILLILSVVGVFVWLVGGWLYLLGYLPLWLTFYFYIDVKHAKRIEKESGYYMPRVLGKTTIFWSSLIVLALEIVALVWAWRGGLLIS